jgi:hypothetical protein
MMNLNYNNKYTIFHLSDILVPFYNVNFANPNSIKELKHLVS